MHYTVHCFGFIESVSVIIRCSLFSVPACCKSILLQALCGCSSATSKQCNDDDGNTQSRYTWMMDDNNASAMKWFYTAGVPNAWMNWSIMTLDDSVRAMLNTNDAYYLAHFSCSDRRMSIEISEYLQYLLIACFLRDATLLLPFCCK